MNMKKVLLIAPKFNEYTEIFARSIESCGYIVKMISFTPYGWKTALFKKIHLSQDTVIQREIEHFNKTITNVYNVFCPEYVIVIRGDFLQRDLLKRMKQHSKLAIWLYDSVLRYPKTKDNWDLYDLHYVFEESDVKILQDENKDAVFLPLGYDEDSYFYIPNRRKNIDISFVGAMYDNRKELLENLALKFNNLNLAFYGIYVAKRDPIDYGRFLFSPFKKAFKNKTVSHREANLLYSKSKININILHEQSIAGWNARLNEILGTGSFQLVTFNPLIANKYAGMLDTFKNERELIDKIVYYLSNSEQREKMAIRGYEWAKENETYKIRFKFILNSMEKL